MKGGALQQGTSGYKGGIRPLDPVEESESYMAVTDLPKPHPRHRTIRRLPWLLERLNISRSMVYLRLDPCSKYYDEHFPKRVRLGTGAIGFIEDEVETYIEYLMAQR